MPQWLLLLASLLALAAGAFALLRANRVDAAMRRALAQRPATIHLAESSGGLCRVAVVRFDAFADVGGKLSSAAALLDDAGSGLVITTMNGRETNRTYVKEVRRGVGTSALSPEEGEAVARAMASQQALR